MAPDQIEGELRRGALGAAGDLGHISVPRGRQIPCRCGNVGCLEALASGQAVVESLRTQGIDLEGALFGERWRIGTAEFEVSRTRNPCASFQTWMGEPQWAKRFRQAGLPGTYLRVTRSGKVAAGDTIEVLYRPAHGVSVGQWFTDPTKETAGALMAAHVGQEFDLRDRQRAEVLRVLGLAEEEAP